MSHDGAVSDSPRTRKGTELLQELASIVAHQVEQAGIEPERARAIGEAAADLVRDHYGGQIVYITKGMSEATRRRWREIWERFNGSNHHELAKAYDLSMPGLYRILAYMRMEERKRRQGRLWPDEQETTA